jgi:hypothetical protein
MVCFDGTVRKLSHPKLSPPNAFVERPVITPPGSPIEAFGKDGPEAPDYITIELQR